MGRREKYSFPPVLGQNRWYAVLLIRAHIKALRKYAAFRGRAGRAEYWWFAAPQCVLAAILAAPFVTPFLNVFSIGYAACRLSSGPCPEYITSMYNPLFVVVDFLAVPLAVITLFFAVPLLAATVRRLHDMDKNGWSILLVALAAAPFVALAALIYVLAIGLSISAVEADGGGSLSPALISAGLFPIYLSLHFPPLAGLVALAVMLSGPGDDGENSYGPPEPFGPPVQRCRRCGTERGAAANYCGNCGLGFDDDGTDVSSQFRSGGKRFELCSRPTGCIAATLGLGRATPTATLQSSPRSKPSPPGADNTELSSSRVLASSGGGSRFSPAGLAGKSTSSVSERGLVTKSTWSAPPSRRGTRRSRGLRLHGVPMALSMQQVVTPVLRASTGLGS